MERIKADFLVTGEVLGRHDLSEVEMERITEDLGVGGLVLRPLSAQALPPSRPEIEGWIDRDSLFGLHEEDWERLVDLARELGLDVEDQVNSPTRCKLAIPGFGVRLENLFEEEGFTLNAVKLLEFGVYYKYPPDVKIVLALDEKEKRALQTFFLPQDLRVYIPTHQGPLALVRTDWKSKSPVQVEEIIALAARITATHSDAANMSSVPIKRFLFLEKYSPFGILSFLSPIR
jgi:tRNA-specific 2-thiouridylase